MNQRVKHLLAFATASALLLSACGSTDNASSNASGTTGNSSSVASETTANSSNVAGEQTDNSISDLVTWELATNEVEDFNVLHSQSASDFNVTTNLVDGLLSNDNEGKLVAGLAESWETTDEGHTWVFHLREGVKWVDVNGEEKADLTSADFITGLEWVLNAKKNEAFNTSMPTEMIEGAQEYLDYTDSLSEEEALALAPDNETFLDMVGIEATDDYTVTYTCIEKKPYFDTVTTYACLYPAPAALIEELGVDGFLACQPDTMWYTGPYLLTSYVHGNEKTLTPNPAWWGADEYTRFNSVTIKMVESGDAAFLLYQNGEIDNVELTESNLNTIYNDESNPYHDYLVEEPPTKYSFQLYFAFDKNLEDGSEDVNWNTAVRNDNFRLAWYYGLDLTNWYKRNNAINPLKCENNCYTMKGLVYTSDGTDYTDLVKAELGIGEYNGESMVRLDADLAAEYKAKAMEELSAQGVTFPVEVDYYIVASDQTALDNADVLKESISESLGDDFVTLNIKTYISSAASEVRTPRLGSIYIGGWGADYGDPQNFLAQQLYDDKSAYYSVYYTCINDVTEEEAPELIAEYKEFTELARAADAITDDLDERYAAFAKAEAYMIQHAFTIPLNYDMKWELTNVNDYSKINAAYGMQSTRYVNWETNADGYTTADYEELAAK